MKPEYKNLKLIIETPTQEAWDAVTEFFGIKWSDIETWHGASYCIRIGVNGMFPHAPYGMDTKKLYTPYCSKSHTFLTFDQFKQQYLNMEEKSQTINVTGLQESQIETIEKLVQELRKISAEAKDFLRIKESASKEPQKTTIKDVYDNLKPTFFLSGHGNIDGISYDSFDRDSSSLQTKQEVERVKSFIILLNCAKWANDGETPVLCGKTEFYRPFFENGKIEMIGNVKQITFPFYLKSQSAYVKFMAIEGIEEHIKTFLNVQ